MQWLSLITATTATTVFALIALAGRQNADAPEVRDRLMTLGLVALLLFWGWALSEWLWVG